MQLFPPKSDLCEKQGPRAPCLWGITWKYLSYFIVAGRNIIAKYKATRGLKNALICNSMHLVWDHQRLLIRRWRHSLIPTAAVGSPLGNPEWSWGGKSSPSLRLGAVLSPDSQWGLCYQLTLLRNGGEKAEQAKILHPICLILVLYFNPTCISSVEGHRQGWLPYGIFLLPCKKWKLCSVKSQGHPMAPGTTPTKESIRNP